MLGGVSGVASFITTDEQLQQNRGCFFLVQAMLPEGFPFYQFNFNNPIETKKPKFLVVVIIHTILN